MQQPSYSSRAQRVVVVDDNVGAALMLSKLVKLVGDYEVEMAHDGPSALEKIHEMKPDLVFLDIGLPSLDGHQVAQDVRNDPKCDGVFLVALTGYGDEEDRRKSEEAGIDEHLVKPPSLSQIQDIFAHPKLAAKISRHNLERPSPTEKTSPVPSEPPSVSVPSPRLPELDLSRLKHDLGNTAHVLKMAIQVLSNPHPGPAVLQNVIDGLSHEVGTLTDLMESLPEMQDFRSTHACDSGNLTAESPD